MGKVKSFLIQALDNDENPFYNLQKIKEGLNYVKKEKEGSEEKRLGGKGFVYESGKQTKDFPRQT